mgnify:FL=1
MKNKEKILIIGAGGHSKSCLEVIFLQNKYEVVGFTDNKIKKLEKLKVLGSDRDIHKMKSISQNLLIGMGNIKDINLRWTIFKRAKKLKFKFPKILSPNSFISKSSKISEGTIIMNHCIINSNVEIGKNTIINNKTLIEHDVKIGNNSHIATGAILNGGVKIGNNVFIGSGAIIKENISIASNSIVGMGSIVLKDLKGGIFYNKL